MKNLLLLVLLVLFGGNNIKTVEAPTETTETKETKEIVYIGEDPSIDEPQEVTPDKYDFLDQRNTYTAQEKFCNNISCRYYYIEAYKEGNEIVTVDQERFTVETVEGDYWDNIPDTDAVVFFDSNGTEETTDDIPLKWEIFDIELWEATH